MEARALQNRNLVREKLSKALERANEIIVDKPVEISLSLSCLLAQGHLLIEDRPGMGKTTLIKTLSQLFGLNSQRIQFTNDLLPSDILGATIFNQKTSSFEFHRGPIFANFILADEINRATPKTQSAFLQAMEEGVVTVDGTSYDLPNPFFIAATQNPAESIGTFSLPESQLDRFLMKIKMGFPSRGAERELLKSGAKDYSLESPIFTSKEMIDLFDIVQSIHVSDTFLDYAQDIIEKSRTLSQGLSPRAAQDLIRASRAWAVIQERDFVIPEDLQAVGPFVMGHRLGDKEDLAHEIINTVRTP